MSLLEKSASIDKIVRPHFVRMFPELSVKFYSKNKRIFLSKFFEESPKQVILPEFLKITLWDLNFNCPIFNSAGMFKNGLGYNVVARQGTGAYLAGTATWLTRTGNTKLGISQPFIAYPHSKSASNWMGLPNLGSIEVAKNLSKIEKIPNCPVGISLSSAPELEGMEALETLVKGLELFDKANVDFIEINESCPNTEVKKGNDLLDEALLQRLEYISLNFIKKLNRRIPVILKFSNETQIAQLEALIDVAITLEFDGINFGNTATNYIEKRKFIQPEELEVFDYFTSNFGGGLSGELLKEDSLRLSSEANSILKRRNLNKEFHIIRTGGIDGVEDINLSKETGTLLNQWYTGYFDNFAKFGHKLYKNLFENKS